MKGSKEKTKMNFEKICYGCFSEKENGVCGKCGLSEDTYQHPVLALPFGTILDGRYITGKVLGMGGFGVTYLGFDLRLNIKVAIKEYLPSGVAVRSGDSYTMTAVSKREEADYRSGADRFLEEARMLAQLRDDPNVVSVQNYFKENNTAYFTMDYIEGKSLKELLLENGGMISFEKAKTLLLPVMRSLTAVHGKGLLHRDISPDNIFITDAGQSKLLDFGAARSALSDKSMSVVLKHGFAPQEQYASHGKQGPWTDVYAMGATLYHCITGEMPPDSVDRAFTDALVPPSKLGIKISENAEQAILKSLAVRPEDRFADMASFMDALQNSTVLYEGSIKEGELGGKGSRQTDERTAYKNRLEPKPNGFSAFLNKIKTDKKLLTGTIISAAIVLTLAVALPLIFSKKPASGAVDNSTSFPLPTIEAPVSSAPKPANYSGTVTLPDIGQFLGTELTTGEREGREVYSFAADSAELLNYVTLLQADDAYSLDSEGTGTKGETFLFKIVQDKAAVQFSIADETGLLMLSCLDESVTAFTDPPVTQEWLNANGITAVRWLEMDEKYGPESEKLYGDGSMQYAEQRADGDAGGYRVFHGSGKRRDLFARFD
jgi:serine/threonine protein kinase